MKREQEVMRDGHKHKKSVVIWSNSFFSQVFVEKVM